MFCLASHYVMCDWARFLITFLTTLSESDVYARVLMFRIPELLAQTAVRNVVCMAENGSKRLD